MRLEGGGRHSGAIRPAVPSTDRKFLLKLLQLEIGAHPPKAAVVALTLRAEAGQQSKVQLGLFAPQTPEPSRLDVTLARLRAMVGEERVGSPVLEDTHRSGAFRMEGFSVSEERVSKLSTRRVSAPTQDIQVEDGARMALRRVRPARVVRVLLSPVHEIRGIPRLKIETRDTQGSVLKPVSFRDGEHAYAIETAYGPWRTSGCWWAVDSWDTEEWDVLAAPVGKLSAVSNIKFADEKQLQIHRLRSPTATFAQDDKQRTAEGINECAMIACLLVHDRARSSWRLEAFYD